MPKLDLAFILAQMRRLEVFYTQRMPHEASDEYVDVCQCAGMDPNIDGREVLSEVIRDFCRYGKKFPYPSDLLNAIVERLQQTEMVPDAPCQQCAGTGYIHVKKLVRGICGESSFEGSEKCRHCNPVGRELPQQSAKRKSERKSEFRNSEDLRNLFEG